MDRILVDDFVLVTGRGRIQCKADSLNESAAGDRTYEQLEDTDRAVREWDDTTVVAVLLGGKGI